MTIASEVHRVRSFLSQSDMTLSDMARKSGLPRSTLFEMRARGWQGSIENMIALESTIIPPDWVPENSIPNDHTGAKDAA